MEQNLMFGELLFFVCSKFNFLSFFYKNDKLYFPRQKNSLKLILTLLFYIYFPKQNLENISFIISSVTDSPVIAPKSSNICFIRLDIISIGIFLLIVSLQTSIFFLAFFIKNLCLLLLTIVSPPFTI